MEIWSEWEALPDLRWLQTKYDGPCLQQKWYKFKYTTNPFEVLERHYDWRNVETVIE